MTGSSVSISDVNSYYYVALAEAREKTGLKFPDVTQIVPCRVYIIKTDLQSLYNIKTAANMQGRLTKKNIFIDVHRFLLVSFVVLIMNPLVVVRFLCDKATLRYTGTITKRRNTLMIFSKS